MAKGTVFPGEAYRTFDPETGVEIWQLTSGPTVNTNLYTHVNFFTRDSNTLIFQSFPGYVRGMTPQIFRVDVDGQNLTQLTDAPGIGGIVLAKETPFVYFLKKNQLVRENILTAEEEVVAREDAVLEAETALGSLSEDDSFYAADVKWTSGGFGIFTADLRSGRTRLLKMDAVTHHVQINPADKNTLLFQYFNDDPHMLWLMDSNGQNLRPLNVLRETGHFTWMGKTGRVLTTADYPRKALVSIADGEAAEQVIVESPEIYFWHAGVSRDGQWIVSDSNWPDQGIFLIHAETGTVRKLCSDYSSKTYQLSHPHPAFSPDGKQVVFNSDRYGFPHVFLAKIPEEWQKI